MTAQFRDRVTGKRSSALPALLLPGLWEVAPERREAVAVQLHGHPVTELHSPVTPGSRLGVAWAVPGGATGYGVFDAKLLPDDTTTGSVHEIVDGLGSPSAWRHDWRRLRAVSPVAPGISARAQVTLFERRIAQWLRHLGAVCQRPRSQLTVEPERVHVSRAKRIAPGAAEFLAAHTEDWHHRTLRGVEPRQVLAITIEDDLNIYENAVAARLVDHLLDHVNRRISEVSRVRWLLEEAHSYSTQAGGTHWRQERIYKLWGEAYIGGDEAIRAQANRTLTMLEEMRRTLTRLLDSRLYRAVPRQRLVRATLRMTNILVNDQHYKWVARLWLARQALIAGAPTEEHEVAARHRETVDGWTRFVAVLVVRALADLGFKPPDSASHLRLGGAPFRVTSGHIAITLDWRADGTLELSSPGEVISRTPVRIVPLAAALSGGAEPKDLAAFLGALGVLEQRFDSPRDASNDRGAARKGREAMEPRQRGHNRPRRLVNTLVVYPSVLHERERYGTELQWALQTLQNDGLSGPRGNTGLVPVSPLAIDSVERLARALRWWLASTWVDAYPGRLRLSPDAVNALRNETFVRVPADAPGTLLLTRRLGQDEVERIEGILRSLRMTPGPRGRVNPPQASALDEFRTQWVEIQRRLEQLFRCLVCGTEATRRDITVREDEQMACGCSSCSAIWGIRACDECGERYPYLIPKAEALTDAVHLPGWVDQAYGRDVLAVPCGCEEPEAFLCPACGACPGRLRSSYGTAQPVHV